MIQHNDVKQGHSMQWHCWRVSNINGALDHEFHVAGLHQLVIHSGELKALRGNPRFECTLFGFGLTNSGIAKLENWAFSRSYLHGLPPSQERQMFASEFWNFLADIIVHMQLAIQIYSSLVRK